MEDIISEVERDYIASLIAEGKRIDGRGFDEYRPIEIETGIYQKADGSAKVTMGNTLVAAGVKLIVGEPYSDTPSSGVLTTSAELIPLAAPTFEKGPPSQEAIEVARVIDRVIRESGAVDFDALCITEKEAVWIAFLDLHILDYDGNLFDCGTLAAIAALLNTQMPKYEDEMVIYEEKTGPLPVRDKPMETTFVKIGKGIVLDPNLNEEQVLDARLTIGTNQDGDICAMQKGGPGTFTQEEILELVNKSKEKAKELRKLL
ncbi:MAG: exosome complex protein Rrp42 [Euryarchaeota archaeon]|nr:exosome complex protein Rrp42 [Euryarchaeota archaeon]